jgi:hypothetical protein
MDAKRGTDERQRCCVCRRKFQPAPSARGHQRTCSKACRLAHEAELARERYWAKPEESRLAGRKRKRRWREGKAAPARQRLPPVMVEVIALEMKTLAAEASLAHERVEQALRRVAQQARVSPVSLGGLGTDSSVNPGG